MKKTNIFIIPAGNACFQFFFIVSKLEIVIEAIGKIQTYIKLDSQYIGILLKMIGITYVAEFSSNLCKDAGYQAVAGQIEMVEDVMTEEITEEVSEEVSEETEE